MLVCNHCQFENSPWASHCQSCQAPLQPSMNCPNCGTIVLKRSNFCGQCGTALRQGSLEQWQQTFQAAVSPPLPAIAALPTPPMPVAELSPEDATPRSGLAQSSLAQSGFAPQLLHIRNQRVFPLPLKDGMVYLGKPNDRHPPNIDISPLPDADVVSRVHARIVVQDGDYYVEDLGSSNGTYLNDEALKPHEPRLLGMDDRISLGRNNLVSFTFNL